MLPNALSHRERAGPRSGRVRARLLKRFVVRALTRALRFAPCSALSRWERALGNTPPSAGIGKMAKLQSRALSPRSTHLLNRRICRHLDISLLLRAEFFRDRVTP